mmetsp:Transcript_8958/g.29767  ORF Transcript_8958/g.29767 Transcript_8958/m.29767 type:complete len:595 (+) Transcript_8958:915-2699(+)
MADGADSAPADEVAPLLRRIETTAAVAVAAGATQQQLASAQAAATSLHARLVSLAAARAEAAALCRLNAEVALAHGGPSGGGGGELWRQWMLVSTALLALAPATQGGGGAGGGTVGSPQGWGASSRCQRSERGECLVVSASRLPYATADTRDYAIALPLLSAILHDRVRAADVQSAATLLAICATAGVPLIAEAAAARAGDSSLPLLDGEAEAGLWCVGVYADLLLRWQLFHTRAQLLKLVAPLRRRAPHAAGSGGGRASNDRISRTIEEEPPGGPAQGGDDEANRPGGPFDQAAPIHLDCIPAGRSPPHRRVPPPLSGGQRSGSSSLSQSYRCSSSHGHVSLLLGASPAALGGGSVPPTLLGTAGGATSCGLLQQCRAASAASPDPPTRRHASLASSAAAAPPVTACAGALPQGAIPRDGEGGPGASSASGTLLGGGGGGMPSSTSCGRLGSLLGFCSSGASASAAAAGPQLARRASPKAGSGALQACPSSSGEALHAAAQPALQCSICALPVRGVAWACGACGHGGHWQCVHAWVTAAAARGELECPTGCGCHCGIASLAPPTRQVPPSGGHKAPPSSCLPAQRRVGERSGP